MTMKEIDKEYEIVCEKCGQSFTAKFTETEKETLPDNAVLEGMECPKCETWNKTLACHQTVNSIQNKS